MTKQNRKTDRNRDKHLNKELSANVPNIIPPRSHSPNKPHILYDAPVPGEVHQQSHRK